MIVTGLVGALVVSNYKWGYFVFAMFALFGIAWNLLWVARKHAHALGPHVNRAFLLTGCWTMFLWFIYPIAWGLSEGGNVISPDSEAAFYGILDILAKPVFGALLLFFHRNIDPLELGIHVRDYEDDINSYKTGSARNHNEKPVIGGNGFANDAGNNGVVEGANPAANGTNRAGSAPLTNNTNMAGAV
jgi:bacteriorhodopsin